MGIVLKKSTVAGAMVKRLEALDNAIMLRLSYLGEECVNTARSNGSYIDQTGNLRNSVGYVICKNGKIVKQNFRRSAEIKTAEKPSKGGKEGLKTGKEFAQTLAQNYPKGYVLIVVAGMNYAAHVESTNRDVLTSAEQYAQLHSKQILDKLI